MKKILLSGLMGVASFTSMAQSLEKMQWFNEPAQWEIKGDLLSMNVTPQTDYWRISHYGFTVDDAPFLYTTRGGEFEVKVKSQETIRLDSINQDLCCVLTTKTISRPVSNL